METWLARIALSTAVVFLAVTTRAADHTWTNEAGGNFSAAGNWDPAGPPGWDDTSILDGTPSASIALSGNVTNDTLQVSAKSGPIVLDLAGHELELQNYDESTTYANWAFALMPTSTLTVTSSAAGGSIKGLGSEEVDSTSLFIDEGATLIYDGANTSVSQVQARVAAGGLWHIKGGADVTLGSDPARGDSYYFGNDLDEPAIIVEGAGSTYYDVTRFVRGCTMLVTNGGLADSFRTSYIGYGGDTGKALITGAGSEFKGHSLYVGRASSDGYITVTNGGLLSHGPYIGQGNDCYAQILVTGEGSELRKSGYLNICNGTYTGTTGLLWVADGGYVYQRNLLMGNGGILRLEDGEVEFIYNYFGRRSIMSGGLVEGEGKIWNSAASDKWFHNDGGVICPGLSGGTLIFEGFDGGFTNGPNAETKFELGGTNTGEYGHLVFSNCNVHLAGTMRATLIDSFEPGIGDRFELIDFASSTVTGTFAIALLPSLTDGQWDVDDLYIDGSISVIEETADEALAYTWQSLAGGDYSQVGFWDPIGGPPGWNDLAILTGTLTDDIVLTLTVSNDTLQVSNATVTLDLAGHDLCILSDTGGTPYAEWGFYCQEDVALFLTNGGVTPSSVGGPGNPEDDSPNLYVDANASLTIFSNVQVAVASARFNANATLDVRGGTLTTTWADGVLLDQATLTGQGIIENVAAAVSTFAIQGSTITPGGGDAGALTIDGFDAVSNSVSSELQILIKGTNDWEYDRLVVADGDLTLAGTLTVSLPRLYTLPTNGATYNILDWGTLSGTFDTVVLPDEGTWITNNLYVDGTISSAAYVLEPDLALTYVWTNPAGGDYSEPLNWNPTNGPPGTNDTARLSSAAPLTVHLSDVYLSNDTLQAAGGPVTLDLNGLDLPLLNYNAGAPYTSWAFYCMTNSQLVVTNTGAAANIGSRGGSLANSSCVFIDDNAVLTVAGSGTTLMGAHFRTEGGGRLVVRDAGHAQSGSDPVRTTSYYYGVDSNGVAPALIVDGTNSTYWDVARYVMNAAMMATNGGTITSYRDLYIGDTSGYKGGVIASGPGSYIVGYWTHIRNGYVRIENGAEMVGNPIVGDADNATAELLITGSNSEYRASYFYVCRYQTEGSAFSGATGTVSITDNGLLHARYMRMATGGTVRVDSGTLEFEWNSYDRRSINDGGRVEGIGTIQHTAATLTWFENNGIIAPGLSDQTGTLTFDGFTAFVNRTGGDFEFELGGTAEGELDRLVFTNGSVTVDGGTLRVSLASGYRLPSRATYGIIDWPVGGVNGAFDTVVLPNRGTWTTNDLYVTGEITVFNPVSTVIMVR